MLSQTWQTSRRKYDIVHDTNVKIPVRAGFELDCDIFRPDAPSERFPVILCAFPFYKEKMLAKVKPAAISSQWASVEGGDYNFYVRRGYVQVFLNVRGTGLSGGEFDHLGDGMIEDLYDAIEWLARQPWCDGQVATFGTSYFAMTAKRVAELKPPSLKTIFAPFATTDQYRGAMFHGGIFSYRFHKYWLNVLSNLRIRKDFRKKIGQAEFDRRVAEALADPEINIHPELVDCLKNPDEGGNMLIVEYVLNPFATEHYLEKTPRFSKVEIPGYFGGCWGMHSLHLPGDFQSFDTWAGPKKLTIGPPYYLDRPVYQYADESLRWFDHWLKGVDTGIMDEPPVSLFIMNTGEWKQAGTWPLPETRWHEFRLHNDGLLSEHEMFWDDDRSSFVEAPGEHGKLEWRTPKFVENTEIVGPLALNFWASTSDSEVLWFATLFQEDETGEETILTRGWLRGSQRRLDPDRSTPWAPYHTHDRREPLTPGGVYEFNLGLVPTGVLLKAGMRLGLRLRATDQDAVPKNFVDGHGYGHLWRETRQEITVFHDNARPSHLLVPVTRGNRIGTFMSGGDLSPPQAH